MPAARHRNQAMYILPWHNSGFVTLFDMQQVFVYTQYHSPKLLYFYFEYIMTIKRITGELTMQ
jgi:hypothetical protein